MSLIEPGAVATPIWQKGKTAGTELARQVSPEGQAFYARAVTAIQRAAAHSARHAIPPEAVAQAVAQALTAHRPRTRYLVGRDARIQALLAQWIPDRVRDRLITELLRLSAWKES